MLRTSCVLVVPLLGACGFTAGGAAQADDVVGDDAGPDAHGVDPDAMPDAPGPICLGTKPHVCMDAVPAPITLTTAIDTNSPSACATTAMNTAAGFCVIAASTITIPFGTTLTVTGNKPVVLFAPSGITVAGVLDVSSHVNLTPGAGAGSVTCGAGTLPGDGGGGQGGSFGGSGGNGGTGRTGAGSAGVAAPVIAFTMLRAGCGGAPGGGSDGGLPGLGGGAASLVAGSINVTGAIFAIGAPGKGGLMSASGGGGGGSGGTIVLDAATITLGGAAVLLAQGGGGGEGSGMNMTAGATGNEAVFANVAALGGSGFSTVGGDGGAGSTNAGGMTAINGSTGGGGGGGGGSGVIGYTSTAAPTGGMVSPPFTGL
ncbi:MAG TPA: hypothetical protein VGM90_31455 [Kofleriaceae bacterium]